MIDPGTGLTLLGSAIGGAKVIERILGPSADYIGNQLKEWSEKKISNTSNIFKNAEKKLGSKIELEGKVPPKILKGILEEGSWCEEELQVEYFGGVLASSRSDISRDDRGAYFVSLIARLSSYQIRAHYLVYQSLKKHFDGQLMNVGDSEDRTKMELFIPYDTYSEAMDFNSEEKHNFHSLMQHSIWGLDKEKLITGFKYGSVEHLKSNYKKVKKEGILLQPSNLGIELFMWAYGYGQLPNYTFFEKTTKFKNEQNILIGETEKTNQR